MITKTSLVAAFLFLQCYAFAMSSPLADTTAIPPEIEDPLCLGIHKEPAHATLMPYGTVEEARKADRAASSFAMRLNGMWHFHWVPRPEQRPVDFYKPEYDVSKWDLIRVPSNWQVEGYGTPYYSNYTYIFQKDFPHIMSTPPEKYTAYEERNPVGSYRRDFTFPAGWKGRRIFITFDGVDAGFFIWVNGKKVGYSVNSRNAADFDITDFVVPGKNCLAVEVYRFTTGSYLEDQDMWRLSGIFRNVTLWSSPQQHIRDFFVHTDLDAQYKDANLRVTAKVKNYSGKVMPAASLTASVYDGANVIGNGEVPVPSLRPGEEREVTISYTVSNPRKWTAETPNLYTTVLALRQHGKAFEFESSLTGFRQIELKGRSFLINGVPIKLKGVNRHEHWPDVGHAITEEQMIKDILLIKQANCNHVRTCHYSDDPRWYELCDQYGIYLLAEANLECHGAWDEFNEEPRMRPAIVERNVSNVENFKNHASVVIWSLGNECGKGGSNFAAALAAIKAIDVSRPTHYEGFGIRKDNPADLDSRMYTSLPDLEKIANDNSRSKPMYLCEYAHAMFNSMGSVDEYNEIFDKYPSLLGGCIWEWQDQGLYNRRVANHPILAFGGGFGEFPNDHYFIHKGVVASDRSVKPHYPELKRAYQWISMNLSGDALTIQNRYQFISLGDFVGKWVVTEDGIPVDSGLVAAGNLAASASKTVNLPLSRLKMRPDAAYYVRVSFSLVHPTLWAPAGFEVAAKQWELPAGGTLAGNNLEVTGGVKLTLTRGNHEVDVQGNGFAVRFDELTGTFSQLESGGTKLLTVGGGPRLHLWRAPHRNDDMWADEGWQKYGLKQLTWTVDKVSSEQLLTGDVKLTASLTGTGKLGFVVHHAVIYTIYPDGHITADNEVSFSDSTVALARLGVRLSLIKELKQFRYFGRGPMENYPDRKQGFDVGMYSGLVQDEMTPYEKPMECGNHEDVRWASLRDYGGGLLAVKARRGLLQVSALPYTDEQMEATEYRIDLPPVTATTLIISHETTGVGSNSCGPQPLAKFVVRSKTVTFEYELRLK